MNQVSGKVETCLRCTRLFQYVGFGVHYCTRCKEIDSKDYELVKQYIYEHPKCNMEQVEEHTGVPIKVQERYLREGRIEITEDSPIFIKCEMCKEDIRYGYYCVECAQKLIKMKNYKSVAVYTGEKPKKGGRMRFIG